jgi:hypothetical protein
MKSTNNALIWDLDLWPWFRTLIWDPDLGPRLGTLIWDLDLGPRFGTPIWDPDLGPWFGTPIWDPDLRPWFGTPILDPDLDLDLGHPHLGPRFFLYKTELNHCGYDCFYGANYWGPTISHVHTQRQSTLDCRYLSLLCDNLEKEKVPPKLVFFLTLFWEFAMFSQLSTSFHYSTCQTNALGRENK